MSSGKPPPELALVAEGLAGKPGAVARLLEIASQTAWGVVAQLEDNPAGRDGAFRHVMTSLAEGGFSRLRPFDGRARLTTFIALIARDLLAERLARSFVETPREVWARFERFFGADIRRRIARRFPREVGTSLHDDAYQEIRLKLIEDDFRRIRSYGGRGSFAGYVLTMVERLLIDLLRREKPRRRLPAAIARLSELDQAIYEAVAWDGCAAEPARLIAVLQSRFEATLGTDDVQQSLQRISALGRLDDAPTGQGETVSLEAVIEAGGPVLEDPGLSPEESLLRKEEERMRAKLIAAVKEAAARLPAGERLYLQIVFSATDPLPPRDIAKQMGCEVTEVYRLKQWAQRWLKEFAAQAEKTQNLSV
jgi:RNA polymerase primary sigma factor